LRSALSDAQGTQHFVVRQTCIAKRCGHGIVGGYRSHPLTIPGQQGCVFNLFKLTLKCQGHPTLCDRLLVFFDIQPKQTSIKAALQNSFLSELFF